VSAIVNSQQSYRNWDENQISVSCAIDGCNGRVVGDTHCHIHGGKPRIEWRESDWGHVQYTVTTEGTS
jgi:hypothetical protein